MQKMAELYVSNYKGGKIHTIPSLWWLTLSFAYLFLHGRRKHFEFQWAQFNAVVVSNEVQLLRYCT